MEDETFNKDLKACIGELSDTYEELALLYRVTEKFAGTTIEEISSTLVDEISQVLPVMSSAVVLLNEEKDMLFTMHSKGKWNSDRVFKKAGELPWMAIHKKGTVTYNCLCETEHNDIIPGARAVIVCPLIGKKMAIGAAIVAKNPELGDFYSNEIKLLNTLTSQAALFIENALLHKEMEEFFIGTIKSFVRAMEATSSWTAGHTERVTEYAVGIGRRLQMSEDELERLKICSVLHDIGKIAVPGYILDKQGKLSEEEWQTVKRHPKVGANILEGLKGFEDIVKGIRYHHEWWDGSKGIFSLKGDEIPLMSRILAVADTFDAMTSDRPYRKALHIKDALKEISDYSGRQFDPKVTEAFFRWLENPVIPQRPASEF